MKKELGLRGENIAAHYLEDKGYSILQRNFYTRYGELDIICKKDKIIIFVEVKTRKSTKYGSPEEAVTNKKILHLRKAALIYLSNLDYPFKEIRFDVITVVIDGKNQETINHIMQAF